MADRRPRRPERCNTPELVATGVGRFYEPEPNTGCWLWLKTVSGAAGYGMVSIDGEMKTAHRLVYEAINGPIPDGLYALHKCDTPSCVNPAHIFLGTIADNNLDRAMKGRNGDLAGEKNGQSKLTAQDAKDVLYAISMGFTQTAVASAFRTSRATVYRIAEGISWS